MLIAIDFDETLTRDAALWRGFIALAKEQGHRVVCVTARRCTEDNEDTIDQFMESHGCCLPVFFTGLASKVEHMAKIGQPVDIWIDDDPKRCALGH